MEEATATAHGFYDYLKLLMDYFSIWSVIVLIGIIWVLRKPDALGHLAKHVESAKFGDFELKLRAIEQKLEDTEALVEELEAENSRLSALYEDFDVHAPVSELAPTRERLRALAGNLEDTQPILDGLKPGASAGDVYAAAEILRARRDFGLFDQLVRTIDRIASDPKLEDLRYHTVWTLASAVHRTVIAAVKHSDEPKLTKDQLVAARAAMQKLSNNPHVQWDRPDAPNQGIRGPAKHAVTWIDRGLAKLKD